MWSVSQRNCKILLSWNCQNSFLDSFELICFYPQNSTSLLCRSLKKRVLGTVHQGSCLNKVDRWGSFSIKDLIYPEKISNTFLQRSMVKSLVNLTFDNKFPNNVLGRCKETHLIFHCNVQQWQQLPSTFSFYWFFCQSTQREAFEMFNVSNYLSFSRGNLVFSGFKFLCEIELVSSE